MRLRDSEIDFTKPQVMAIVNITDDSFYSASRTIDGDSVALRVRDAIEQGASIIDVGGYSSRPGAKEIPLEQEWQRVRLGVAAVRSESMTIPISIDTFRSEIARRVIEEFGEVIINDITAGGADKDMVDVVARYDVPYVAMHMRGTPQTMQLLTEYENGVVAEVYHYFEQRIKYLRERGVEKIILDPGFGFAKSVEQNYELLGGLSRLSALGYPILVGISRKSMIYKPLEITPEQALSATTALHWEALRQGATILRVHDVVQAREVIRLYDIYRAATKK
jgi:dihydropteroate synthase